MDMQIKFAIETIINKKVVNSDRKILGIDEALFKDGYLGDEVVSFYEYNKIKVNFSSTESNSILEIECYNSEKMVIIEPGDEWCLISPGNSNGEEGLVPGYYSLVIRTQNKIYEGMYLIKPASIEWNRLLKIRDYLENIVQGLSYNLYLERTGQLDSCKQQDVFLSQVYKFIENNFYIFINNMNSIIKNPLTNIIKVYSEKNISRRPDRKSQKWLTKKGISLNNNPYRPIVNLEQHITLTKNTFENKWIKNILVNLYKILNDVESRYICIINSLSAVKNDTIFELNEYKKRLKGVLGKGYISKDYKCKNCNKIKFLTGKVKELNNNLNILEQTVVNLKKIKGTLIHYNSQTWLKDIEDYGRVKKTSICLLKDRRYSQIYGFYKKINCINDKKNKNGISFMHKKTSLLYEYYIFTIVINILKSNGYNWKSGWLADEEEFTLKNGELASETICRFEKEDTYCELVYDMEIEGDEGIDNNPNTSRFITINSKHRRPDIRLALYSDNGKLKKAAIIEVKCRKKKYLIDSSGETKVMEQLKDYYNFGYYEAEKKSVRKGVIDKVIVPYPKQNTSKIKYSDYIYNFSFIQVEPADENEIPYGYDDLNKEISEFLNNDT